MVYCCNNHNSGTCPSYYILFEIQHFADWVLFPSWGQIQIELICLRTPATTPMMTLEIGLCWFYKLCWCCCWCPEKEIISIWPTWKRRQDSLLRRCSNISSHFISARERKITWRLFCSSILIKRCNKSVLLISCYHALCTRCYISSIAFITVLSYSHCCRELRFLAPQSRDFTSINRQRLLIKPSNRGLLASWMACLCRTFCLKLTCLLILQLT
jgi:hypothetical protein